MMAVLLSFGSGKCVKINIGSMHLKRASENSLCDLTITTTQQAAPSKLTLEDDPFHILSYVSESHSLLEEGTTLLQIECPDSWPQEHSF